MDPQVAPDEAQTLFALNFGRHSARVLYPTIRWEEAKPLLAQMWREKQQERPWVLMEPTVRAGWNEVAADVEGSALRV